MKITRRAFAKTTAGAGLLYALGARTRDAGAATYGPETTTRTFHFDLSHYEPFVKHFLRAGGRSYFLETHTTAEDKVREVIVKLRAQRLTKAAELVEAKAHETLTYFAFPSNHWRQVQNQQSTRADHPRDTSAHACRGCVS